MNGTGAASVTVLMPMRNARAFVSEAINSILAQTESDFTFLIIDDGSDDGSAEIAERLGDSRTRILNDGNHLGLAARLNWGLDHAGTKFVARMDADDIAAPFRLSSQLRYMRDNPQVGICGSWYRVFGSGNRPADMRLPLDHDRLRAMTLFASPFAHPTVMFNMAHLDAAGLRYSEAATHAEDYELWERAAASVIFANIPEFLLYHRLHGGQVSERHRAQQAEIAASVRKRALARYGFSPTPEELALHCDYAADIGMNRIGRLRAARRWLARLGDTATRMGESAIAAECANRRRALKRRIRQRARQKIADAIRRLVAKPAHSG